MTSQSNLPWIQRQGALATRMLNLETSPLHHIELRTLATMAADQRPPSVDALAGDTKRKPRKPLPPVAVTTQTTGRVSKAIQMQKTSIVQLSPEYAMHVHRDNN
jgi:hypothetical protein